MSRRRRARRLKPIRFCDPNRLGGRASAYLWAPLGIVPGRPMGGAASRNRGVSLARFEAAARPGRVPGKMGRVRPDASRRRRFLAPCSRAPAAAWSMRRRGLGARVAQSARRIAPFASSPRQLARRGVAARACGMRRKDRGRRFGPLAVGFGPQGSIARPGMGLGGCPQAAPRRSLEPEARPARDGRPGRPRPKPTRHSWPPLGARWGREWRGTRRGMWGRAWGSA